MKLLGIAGKKKSGKNTLANSVVASKIAELALTDYVRLGTSGEIIVPTEKRDKGDNIVEAVLDLTIPEAWGVLNKRCVELHKVPFEAYISLYSFADPLKQFCMDVFGLTHEQCYGSDEDKNSESGIQWGNFQSFVKEPHDAQSLMSARQVLQCFGTDVCREIKKSCWVNSTINKIKRENPACAIITDIRFANEVRGVKNAGGKVIHLTRDVCCDSHVSEKDLNDYKKFDGTIDNDNMSLEESLGAFVEVLKDWEWSA